MESLRNDRWRCAVVPGLLWNVLGGALIALQSSQACTNDSLSSRRPSSLGKVEILEPAVGSMCTGLCQLLVTVNSKRGVAGMRLGPRKRDSSK